MNRRTARRLRFGIIAAQADYHMARHLAPPAFDYAMDHLMTHGAPRGDTAGLAYARALNDLAWKHELPNTSRIEPHFTKAAQRLGATK